MPSAKKFNLTGPGSEELAPSITEASRHHPSVLLKIYVTSNQIKSSGRLEREIQRNVELACGSANGRLQMIAGSARTTVRKHADACDWCVAGSVILRSRINPSEGKT